jgi:pimeloyl-ACP methyl ester carboxylesterase
MVSSLVDGGPLEVVTRGSGPDVVLVGGGGTDASTYRRLVAQLAQQLTVHVPERRGRGRSAARPADYSLQTEIGDLRSVLADTGATRLIGHSSGGLFALATAREAPIERLALSDPAVSVDGLFPSDFLPAFERAAAGDDPVEAMLIAGKGLRNPGSGMPRPLGRALVRLVLLTPEGRTMGRLIGTVPAETRLALEADGPPEQWAGVTARTRFYVGARGPDYYLPSAQRLVAAMPHADLEVVPRLGHDALARAPRALVASLTEFLTG